MTTAHADLPATFLVAAAPSTAATTVFELPSGSLRLSTGEGPGGAIRVTRD